RASGWPWRGRGARGAGGGCRPWTWWCRRQQSSVLPLRRLVSGLGDRLPLKPDLGEQVLPLLLERHRVLHVLGVVAVRVILAGVTAAGLLAVEGADDGDLRQLQEEAELDGFQEFGVEPLALVGHGHVVVALLERAESVAGLGERLLVAEHRRL